MTKFVVRLQCDKIKWFKMKKAETAPSVMMKSVEKDEARKVAVEAAAQSDAAE